ncbi:MAG: SAM-dependent chlorinase/fluorinase, partial [Desulfurococcaceae archaeon]
MKKLIVLLTDYGYRDPYVGVVKGVIKSINPEAEVIDLTHGVERHNILEAAVILAVSAKYFPRNTVFVVVVDPGVGSSRRSILIETSNYILLG